MVNAAIDAGITLFDVADIYGQPAGRSEELLGLPSAAAGVTSSWRRSSEWTRTVRTGRISARGGPVATSVRQSRHRCAGLNTDWIDLYQLHQPDPLTPIEETLAALDELVAAGKVRYVGHSNFTGWQLADADWVAKSSSSRVPFISAQNEYSLLNSGYRA